MVENKESRWSPGLVWSFCDEGKAREYMRIIVVFNSSSFKKKTKKKQGNEIFAVTSVSIGIVFVKNITRILIFILTRYCSGISHPPR